MAHAIIRLDDDAQRWADQAIAALGEQSRLPFHPLLTSLYEWLNDDERLVECICDQGNWWHAPTLREVVHRAWDTFEGPETEDAVLAHLHAVAQTALDADSAFWGDEYPVEVTGSIRSSEGRSAVIAFRFLHFSCDPDWHGLFRSQSAFAAWLRGSGRILDLEQFERIPRSELLRAWTE